MTAADWENPHSKCLTVRLAPDTADENSLLVMLNASHVDVPFTTPPARSGGWEVILGTSGDLEGKRIRPGRSFTMPARTLVLWEWRP